MSAVKPNFINIRNIILHGKRTATMDKALATGFTEAADYLIVWTVYCDYLRRRINWNAGKFWRIRNWRE